MMKKTTFASTVNILGILSVLIGVVHVFVPNASPYHDPLQLVLAIGLLLICGGVFLNKRLLKEKSQSG